jgi:signal transduction histidine kinase/ActR/RegA family two-component response regulator
MMRQSKQDSPVDGLRRALHASEARFRAIVDRSADGIIVLRSSGEIVYVNPAAEVVLDQQAERLIGKNFGVPAVPGDATEIEVIRDEGAKIIAEIRVVTTHWQGKPALLATLRDITERNQREREIREAIECRDHFLAVLSHELRNPLASIVSATEVLRRADDDNSQRQAREVIERESRHMRRMLDDLLDVSRVTKGKITLRKTTVDLVELVRHVAGDNEALMREADLRFKLTVSAVPLYAQADSTRIRQVLTNLLTNAVRYSKPRGHIWITVCCEGDEHVIVVCDDGVGIPQNRLDSIFEPFEQVESDISRSNCGLGMGLALVKKLVGLHGGSVMASSDGPGLGSEFAVRLPAAPAPDPPVIKQPQVDEIQPRKIFVVEDNADARETLKMLLELEGHVVETAADGRQAVDLIDLHRPDLALVDIGLPIHDGYEVARRARKRWGAKVRLVALTGYGQPEDRRRALDAGFDAHVTKPLDYTRLAKLIAQLDSSNASQPTTA